MFLFLVGNFYAFFFSLAKASFFFLLLALFVDGFLLFIGGEKVKAQRICPERLSNGDENTIHIKLENQYPFKASFELIDELPYQFQERDFSLHEALEAGASTELSYYLIPKERGNYNFGNLNAFAKSPLGLVIRRYIFDSNQDLSTYPSFIHLRKYQLMAFSNKLQHFGMRKIRKVGQTLEFDQIRNYVMGDDIRHINWKATAKQGELMVNQYQDERSQNVYSVIDKGRLMQLPFDGLSLLDYAINASLAISDIALLKHDRAGVLSFSNKIENVVAANSRNNQMQLIMESLNNLETEFKETDFGRLYAFVSQHIRHRSLLLCYTNFETMDALHRQLPYIKALSRKHLVVVIFFKNRELEDLAHSETEEVIGIFDKVAASKIEQEKKLIVAELKKYGIHSLLTSPQNLTVETINKYLELKARSLF